MGGRPQEKSCRNGSHSRGYRAGFTLAELLVSVAVLVLLVLLASQLLNTAATVTTLGLKQMDADSQARQLLDRMAVDFAQMVKRSDVDYYVKSSASAPLRRVLQPGNDQIAFYSAVPGYYPSTGAPSPVSLVAYRLNSDSTSSAYNKMERMGKGLVWNAVSTTDTPVVFIPIPVASPLSLGDVPAQTPTPTPTPAANPAWPQAGNMAADASYEVIGHQVFRFEYYYLLKTGAFSDVPWDTSVGHYAVDGMQDVSAIVVAIAVIDPKSKVLLTDAQIATLTTPGNENFLVDYSSGMTPGQLRTQWQNTVNAITSLPRPALSGIRFYERFLHLSPPTLLTP
jgi:prepilin-type N-terminal cleavage/methylation domain-containing protein